MKITWVIYQSLNGSSSFETEGEGSSKSWDSEKFEVSLSSLISGVYSAGTSFSAIRKSPFDFYFDVIIWHFQPIDNSKLLFKRWFFPVVILSLRGWFLLGQLRARQKWPPGSTPFCRGLFIIINLISFWVQFPSSIYASRNLKISDSQYFIIGSQLSTNYLHFLKVTFGNTNVDWDLKHRSLWITYKQWWQ